MQKSNVIEHFLNPLVALFNKTLNEQQIKIFSEELAFFSNQILQEAARQIIRVNRYFPTISESLEACRDRLASQPRTETKKSGSDFYCISHAEIAHPGTARAILESSVGQLALELGVGRELLTEYEKTGQAEFDEAFVRNAKAADESLCIEINKLVPDNSQSQAFLGLFQAMQEREKRLYAKFYKKAQAA